MALYYFETTHYTIEMKSCCNLYRSNGLNNRMFSFLNPKKPEKHIETKIVEKEEENLSPPPPPSPQKNQEQPSPEEPEEENPESPEELEIPTSYIIEDQQEDIRYSYLEGNPLFRIEPTIDETKKYSKGICFYRINQNLEEPFLEFFFIKKDGKFSFPFKLCEPGIEGIGEQLLAPKNIKKTMEQNNPETEVIAETETETEKIKTVETVFPFLYDKTEEPPEEEESDEPDITLEDYFREQSAFWFSFPQDDDYWDRHYKGFVELLVDEITYYIAFIDCTFVELSPAFLELMEHDENKTISEKEIEEIRWGILDEIVEKKKILNVPIYDVVYQLFIENPFLGYLKTNSQYGNKIAALPHCLYLCKEDGKGNFDNVYYEDDKPLYKQKQTIAFFKPRLFTPHFGMTHFFTKEPLDINEKLPRIKRYAVLIDKPIHVFNYDSDITEFPELFDNDNIEENISFYINQYAFWSIRNSDSFVEII